MKIERRAVATFEKSILFKLIMMALQTLHLSHRVWYIKVQSIYKNRYDSNLNSMAQPYHLAPIKIYQGFVKIIYHINNQHSFTDFIALFFR